MKSETKESISRISLIIIFSAMLIYPLLYMVGVGGVVVIYAFLGVSLTLVLILGVVKHRKFICIGLIVVLLLVMIDHIAYQKLNRDRILSYSREIEELEIKLDRYESQDNKIQMDTANKSMDGSQ
ncbi:MAG: hypothetical protein ISS71_02045 [Phycisphaerae bacterium]|nr:hypothetical protein [Phycisphaerae bacterium]